MTATYVYMGRRKNIRVRVGLLARLRLGLSEWYEVEFAKRGGLLDNMMGRKKVLRSGGN